MLEIVDRGRREGKIHHFLAFAFQFVDQNLAHGGLAGAFPANQFDDALIDLKSSFNPGNDILIGGKLQVFFVWIAHQAAFQRVLLSAIIFRNL